MKVCIFGAGAVGGYLAARIGHANTAQISVIARGAHKDAIARNGIRLDTPEGSITVHPSLVTDRPEELPEQDLVFVTLKVMSQSAAAPVLRRLTGDRGCAIFAANGIPWWWKHGTEHAAHLPLLDPDGALWNILDPSRALGCVVYSANEVIAPGVVRHLGNNRWVMGEPDGSISPRLQAAVQLMQASGVNGEASPDIHTEIWAKLLRNATLNSLCALTRLPVDGLAEDPALLAQADTVIDEIISVASAQGCDITAQRAAAREQLRRGGAEGGAPPVKGLRPSMLQDALAGRPLEVEAIVGQVQALAQESRIPCPAIDTILPLLRGLNRSLINKSL
ncbi:ketopantoate reductase family protein [Pollutimonas harenae]|uniref:2-dehydropantoate 2-reductase n=1 Tax=Pollutimonas harenae TaxID=657015 RepID=A0A853H0K7_9BURK|nr:2-dehydropantoate 2-reductase [Pollutimonas harenae]NYT84805.1 2-dehydropantoate 2-reductase [Pollutimonas harenae]